MSDHMRLSAGEVVSGRPFTDVAANAADLTALRHMGRSLRQALRQASGGDGARGLQMVDWGEAHGRMHRIVIAQPERLRQVSALPIVGFFGQMRPGADRTMVDEVDLVLIQDLPRFPEVLSYSSLELEDGNCGNLVTFAQPEAREHWRTSVAHARAVRDIAPKYYRSVRLHNATLPRGLEAADEIRLVRTKYYDYEAEASWMAVREYDRET